MSLDKLTTSDLLYCLRQQYRAGIHTCNPCVACGQTAIGAGHCKYCVAAELRNRLGDKGRLVDLHIEGLEAIRRMEEHLAQQRKEMES